MQAKSLSQLFGLIKHPPLHHRQRGVHLQVVSQNKMTDMMTPACPCCMHLQQVGSQNKMTEMMTRCIHLQLPRALRKLHGHGHIAFGDELVNRHFAISAKPQGGWSSIDALQYLDLRQMTVMAMRGGCDEPAPRPIYRISTRPFTPPSGSILRVLGLGHLDPTLGHLDPTLGSTLKER